jgi:translation initiation factor 2B subunit (eIF-2B alpha/beta/delta family)
MATAVVTPWLKAQKKEIQVQFSDFHDKLRRRKIRGSDRCGRETLLLLKRMLGSCQWQNTQQMMERIKSGSLGVYFKFQTRFYI